MHITYTLTGSLFGSINSCHVTITASKGWKFSRSGFWERICCLAQSRLPGSSVTLKNKMPSFGAMKGVVHRARMRGRGGEEVLGRPSIVLNR
jgi:hypothetical protein